MKSALPNIKSYFRDPVTDTPLIGGKVWTYVGGSESTLKTSWADPLGSSANTNPVILEDGGAHIYLTEGESYKIVVMDSNDTIIDTQDNVTIASGGTSGTAGTLFEVSQLSTDADKATYAMGNVPVTFQNASAIDALTLNGATDVKVEGSTLLETTDTSIPLDIQNTGTEVPTNALKVTGEYTTAVDITTTGKGLNVTSTGSEHSATFTGGSVETEGLEVIGQTLMSNEDSTTLNTLSVDHEGTSGSAIHVDYNVQGTSSSTPAVQVNTRSATGLQINHDPVNENSGTSAIRVSMGNSEGVGLRIGGGAEDTRSIETEGVIVEQEYTLSQKYASSLTSGTSLLTGGTLSVGGAIGTFSITGGTVEFVSGTPYWIPENQGVTKEVVHFASGTDIACTFLATHPVTYVGIQGYDGSIQQSTIPFTASQRRSIIPIGVVVHSDNTTVLLVNNLQNTGLQVGNQTRDLMEALGFFSVSGNIISANGANLNMDKSAGIAFKAGSNFTTDRDDPHTLSLPLQSALTFRYRAQDSVEESDTIAFDPYYIDVGGEKRPLSGDLKAGVQRVYIFPSGAIRVQRGQEQFNNLSQAIEMAGDEAFTPEPNISQNGLLLALIAHTRNCSDLTDASQAKIFHASRFGEFVSASSSAVGDLQDGYDNSTPPQIVTDGTRGAITIQGGTGNDTDNVLEGQDNAGAETFAISAGGTAKASGGFRATGQMDPTDMTGAGIEIAITTGGVDPRLMGFNRTTGLRIPLRIDGNPVYLYNNNAIVAKTIPTGLQVIGVRTGEVVFATTVTSASTGNNTFFRDIDRSGKLSYKGIAGAITIIEA